MKELLARSAAQIAHMIRKREVSSREAVDAHIAKVEEVNPSINAVVVDRFAEARKEADAADRLLASGATDLSPLHGVPCTIKECYGLAGMPLTAGMVSRKNFIAPQDATAVARLRKAGAIPIGVTNVSELCMWMETSNRLYGRTNNPYNPAHIVGGSSGGEGAIVGSGASPFGLGGDIGGSIRMPAFFNGVFGHKPSGGLVPSTGKFPLPHGEALRYLTTGPISRKAEDLWPLTKILAGPDGRDEGCSEFNLGDPAQVDVSKLRVFNVTSNGRKPVSEDLQRAQSGVVAYLERLGCKIRDHEIPELKDSFFIWSSSLGQCEGPGAFRKNLECESTSTLLKELLKWPFRISDHTLPAILLGLLENLSSLTPERNGRMVQLGKKLKQDLENLLGDDGILLYPSFSKPAPKHHEPLYQFSFDWVYTAIFNILEMPATQIPLGLNQHGLPLGVQAIARKGNDHLTVAVAMELERAFGGWVPPWEARVRESH